MTSFSGPADTQADDDDAGQLDSEAGHGDRGAASGRADRDEGIDRIALGAVRGFVSARRPGQEEGAVEHRRGASPLAVAQAGTTDQSSIGADLVSLIWANNHAVAPGQRPTTFSSPDGTAVIVPSARSMRRACRSGRTRRCRRSRRLGDGSCAIVGAGAGGSIGIRVAVRTG